MDIPAIDWRRRGGPQVIANRDIIDTLPDGRTIQVAVKGAPLPLATAIRAGLVADPAGPGPRETKEGPRRAPVEVPLEAPVEVPLDQVPPDPAPRGLEAPAGKAPVPAAGGKGGAA